MSRAEIALAPITLLLLVGACGGLFGACGGKEASSVVPDADARQDTSLEWDVAVDTHVDETTLPTRDAAAETRTDGEVAPPIDAGPPCAPISGPKAFGVVVEGPITFDEPSSSDSARAFLLFPGGRVAGAPVHLTMQLFPDLGFASASSTLDSRLGATLRVTDPHCGNTIDGTLVGPDDGLVARVGINYLDTDAIRLRMGVAKLCATSTIEAAPSVAGPSTLLPLDSAHFTASLPFDPVTLAGVRASTTAALVPTTPRLVDGFLDVTAVAAFPPAPGTVDFELSGARDLLGRSLAMKSSVAVRVPTGALADRTFATLPSTDAMLALGGITPKLDAGALSLKGDPYGAFRVVLALGTEPGAKAVRFRHRAECPSSIYANEVTFVGADGSARILAPPCSSTFVDEVVPIPSAQPTYLVVKGGQAHARCTYPSGPDYGTYVLDDVAFSP